MKMLFNYPITGVMVQYYVSCERELWFFSHKLNFDNFDQNMLLGRQLHKKHYLQDKKEILIDETINLDFVRKNKTLIVYEIKKSSKLLEPALYQLYYYLWYLKHRKGVIAEGVLVCPKEKKKINVILSQEIERRIEEILKDIPKIIDLKIPPKADKKPYCKKCSYYEFCWC